MARLGRGQPVNFTTYRARAGVIVLGGTLGIAEETDTTGDIALKKGAQTASETDTAGAIGRLKTQRVSQTTVTESFTGSAGPLSGTNWTAMSGASQVEVDGAGAGTATTANVQYGSYWSGSSPFHADQFATATVFIGTTVSEFSLFVRSSTTFATDAYQALFDKSGGLFRVRLIKYVGSTPTTLGTFTISDDTYDVTLRAVGSRISVSIAGVGEVIVVTDTSITSGVVAIGAFRDASIGTTVSWDDFFGGYVSAAPSETDTAGAIGHTFARAVGVASETDSAIAISRIKTKAVTFPSETDTAGTFGRTKTRAIKIGRAHV